MTTERVDRTVDTEGGTDGPSAVRTETRSTSRSGPGGSEMTRRIVVLIFGLIQVVIGARILLLLLDAREANGLVTAILNASQLFVAPFEGILRTDALHAAGSTLDLTAIVAFVGWTVVEIIVIWAVAIFRREPA
jgi:YGGT family